MIRHGVRQWGNSMALWLALLLALLPASALANEKEEILKQGHVVVQAVYDGTEVASIAPILKLPGESFCFVAVPTGSEAPQSLSLNGQNVSFVIDESSGWCFVLGVSSQNAYDCVQLLQKSDAKGSYDYLTNEGKSVEVKASDLQIGAEVTFSTVTFKSKHQPMNGTGLLNADKQCVGIAAYYVDGECIFVLPNKDLVLSAKAAFESNEAAQSVIVLSPTKEMPDAWDEYWWIAAIALAVALVGGTALCVVAAGAKGKRYYLDAVASELAGKRYRFKNGMSIGRDGQKCAIVFSESVEGVSRIHCSLKQQSGHVVVTDLGSAYGTFTADGRRLGNGESCELQIGQSFYLGKSNHNGFTLQQ